MRALRGLKGFQGEGVGLKGWMFAVDRTGVTWEQPPDELGSRSLHLQLPRRHSSRTAVSYADYLYKAALKIRFAKRHSYEKGH